MYITHNIDTLKSILSSRKTVSHKGTKSCSPVRLQQGNNAYQWSKKSLDHENHHSASKLLCSTGAIFNYSLEFH